MAGSFEPYKLIILKTPYCEDFFYFCNTHIYIAMASHRAKDINFNGQKLQHPDEIGNWTDDTKYWPSITLQEITIYLIVSKAVDGQEMRNHRFLDSYNYFQSGSILP